MKKLIVALCLSLAAGSAFAKDEKAATPQQERMQNCNKEAKEKNLAGDARKKFMSECLSNKPAAAAESKKEVTPQQQKMKDCNKTAGEKALKGDERKKFMSECLKGGGKPVDKK